MVHTKGIFALQAMKMYVLIVVVVFIAFCLAQGKLGSLRAVYSLVDDAFVLKAFQCTIQGNPVGLDKAGFYIGRRQGVPRIAKY